MIICPISLAANARVAIVEDPYSQLVTRSCLFGFVVYHSSITEGFFPIYSLCDMAESCTGGIYFPQFEVFLYTAATQIESVEGTAVVTN